MPKDEKTITFHHISFQQDAVLYYSLLSVFVFDLMDLMALLAVCS